MLLAVCSQNRNLGRANPALLGTAGLPLQLYRGGRGAHHGALSEPHESILPNLPMNPAMGRVAKANGLSNVRFLAADFREIDLSAAVDAIVGRLVLMYAADPLDALHRALRNLRAGGIIALQESIIDYDGPVLIEPLNCLAARAVEWFRAGFKHAGVHPRMGLRLFGLMRAAGLDPSIEIEMLVPIQQDPEGELFRILTSVVRSQLPAIVASGAATEAEIDIETLEQRLIAGAPPQGVVGYFNSGHVGVWARKL